MVRSSVAELIELTVGSVVLTTATRQEFAKRATGAWGNGMEISPSPGFQWDPGAEPRWESGETPAEYIGQ